MHDKQVVWITGASSGIGYATALAFAQQGAVIVGTARDLARLDKLQAAIDEYPNAELMPLAVDVQERETVIRAAASIQQRYGRLDVLVANAGVGHRGGIVEAEWNDVEQLLRTNIDGVLHTIRAGVPLMKVTGGGHIVLLSSVVYNMVVPYAAYYAASKAFVSSLGRSLRLELEEDNIRVTEMIVGRTATNFDQNRLGGQRTGQSIPSMTAEQVAAGIVRGVKHDRTTVALRILDRLMVIGNILVPNVIGRIALKQYR